MMSTAGRGGFLFRFDVDVCKGAGSLTIAKFD